MILMGYIRQAVALVMFMIYISVIAGIAALIEYIFNIEISALAVILISVAIPFVIALLVSYISGHDR